jgi:hypothetical protein
MMMWPHESDSWVIGHIEAIFHHSKWDSNPFIIHFSGIIIHLSPTKTHVPFIELGGISHLLSRMQPNYLDFHPT